MTWISQAPGFTETLAVLPELSGAYETLYASLWRQQHIPPAVLELCRLRLAQLHGSDCEWQREQIELPSDQREHLGNWNTHPAFSEGARACLAFTEVYAMDAQALTDEQAEAVKAFYGDAGLVLLVEALGILDGRVRLSLLWQLPVGDAR